MQQELKIEKISKAIIRLKNIIENKNFIQNIEIQFLF